VGKFQFQEKYEGHKPEQVFNAGKAAFEALGMAVVKDRSFAFLLQTKTSGDADVINANFIVSPFQNEYNLTLTSETTDQETLEAFAKAFADKLKENFPDS
jgi:hypothetical protein